VNEPTSRSGGKATAVQKIRKVSPVAFHLMLFSDNTCKADYIGSSGPWIQGSGYDWGWSNRS